ncbi:MAG: hypothetical protein JJT89_06430 [Nitriliruptoraceae bacterium]|nr:hypothetical protein [Nitriliruptoraceae bacterium]
MGKALFGASVDARSLQLMDEVRSLRQRVAELEAALEAAQQAAHEAERTAADHEPAVG